MLTTTLTNLDLHDLARSARTYGAEAFFMVHPVASQRMLAQRIKRHWVQGAGRKRIPDRAEALALLRCVATVEEARAGLAGPDEPPSELWTTAADARGAKVHSNSEARAALREDGPPVLLCFGTGWGLAPELTTAADVRIEPIQPPGGGGYNHLSVRAACAITLDRLLG